MACKWREAVLDACVVSWVDWDENDPRKTINSLLAWHQMVALDPAVSVEAAKLIEQGRQEVMGVPVNRVTNQNVDEVFSYHKASAEEASAIEEVRLDAKRFAKTILRVVPEGADQQAGLRLLRQAMMTCNQAIVLENVGVTGESEREGG